MLFYVMTRKAPCVYVVFRKKITFQSLLSEWLKTRYIPRSYVRLTGKNVLFSFFFVRFGVSSLFFFFFFFSRRGNRRGNRRGKLVEGISIFEGGRIDIFSGFCCTRVAAFLCGISWCCCCCS